MAQSVAALELASVHSVAPSAWQGLPADKRIMALSVLTHRSAVVEEMIKLLTLEIASSCAGSLNLMVAFPSLTNLENTLLTFSFT